MSVQKSDLRALGHTQSTGSAARPGKAGTVESWRAVAVGKYMAGRGSRSFVRLSLELQVSLD